MKSIPYSKASAGQRARDEITKVLRRFGAEEVGFKDNYSEHELLLYFKHRGRQVQLTASGKGWAVLWLKENPWTNQRHTGKQEWERKALDQGLVAVSSVLRDWVKGQVTCVECGILSFEAVFLPFM